MMRNNTHTITKPDNQLLTCPDGTRPRILFAEDATVSRLLTATLLRRIGCNVDMVEHGEEALMLLKSFEYDVVVLDVEMPVMDGLETARRIKTLKGRSQQIPIVALSAFLDTCMGSNTPDDEFDVHVSKPVDQNALKSAIRLALHLEDGFHEDKTCDSCVPGLSAREHSRQFHYGDDVVDEAGLILLKQQFEEDVWEHLLEAAINDLLAMRHEMVQASVVYQPLVLKRELHKLSGIACSFAIPGVNALSIRLRDSLQDIEQEKLLNSVSELIRSVEVAVDAMRNLNNRRLQ